MNKILILSLTRMGDLLQSTPLMAGLKKKYPDVKLDVLVSSDFTSVANSIPTIDEVKVLNLRQFTPAKHKENLTLVKVFRYVEGIIKRLKETKYDTVINLSHSKLSAIMTTLIGVDDIRGITSTDIGNRMVKHPWLRYFASVIFNRNYNSFNLVDIYLKSGDLDTGEDRLFIEVEDKSSVFAEDFLSQQGVTENDFLVGFQTGSSLKGRRWPTKSFAELGTRIHKELNGKVILFGVQSEANLGEKIEERMEEKPINAMGKTSIQQLAALVKRCDVLITNDTGTMHIATAVGTRVVGLFFAHALPMETGPYSSGNVIFQANIPCSPCSYGVTCNNPVCVDYVTVEHLFQVLKCVKDGIINETCFNNDYGMGKIQLFRSDFDQDQMLEFLPIIKRPLTKDDFFRFVYRAMWKITLGGSWDPAKRGTANSIEQLQKNIAEKLENYYCLNEFSNIYPYVKVVLEEFNRLWQISKQACHIAEKLIQASNSSPPELNEIKSLGDKITDLDEKINLMGYTNPVIKPIIDIFRLGKENLEGDILNILAKDTFILYQDMKHQAGIVYQLGSWVCDSIRQSFDTSL